MSRLWLALSVCFFCLPLYIGLGRADISGDEAGHSFSVDRILEIGDWLAPKSSPSETVVFLEKPPLKFWLVAAPIRLGLLPHDEFGLRFWDPLLAGVAFLYVFALASRLGGAVAGLVSVLILFVQPSLLFEHGVRGNNMEAALLLSYCGAMFHAQEWARLTPEPGRPDAGTLAGPLRRAWPHAAAVAVFFALGFMVKFVAAAFVPIVLGVTALLFREWRVKVLANLRQWLGATALVVALVAPWFAYASVRFGAELWQTMFGAHVYERFTAGLDPTHLQPWSFYFTTMGRQFGETGTMWWVVGGLALLTVMTIRRRWPEGGLVLLWLALPLGLISSGSSKLYHYAYPFLPPAAIAGGYLAGMACWLVPPPVARALGSARDALLAAAPAVRRALERPSVRAVLLALGGLAAGVGVVTAIRGSIRVSVAGMVLLKASGIVRPLVLVALAGVLAGPVTRAARAVALVVVLSLLPTVAYRNVFTRLDSGEHPMRTARDCLRGVNARLADSAGPGGFYMDGLGYGFGHEHYYYFRSFLPRETAVKPSPGALDGYLHDARPRPMLVLDSVYRDYLHGAGRPADASGAPASVPAVGFADVDLLLPGPYAVCSPAHGAEPPAS